MNRAILTEKLSKAYGLPKSTIEGIISDVFDNIATSLENGRKASFKNFGTFSPVEAKARVGRNPQTGEAVHIPAKTRVKFVPSRRLKSL